MVGSGVRRDEGSLVINSTNVFAALDTRRKANKSKDSKTKKSSLSNSGAVAIKEPDPKLFWAPKPLKATSWADIDDEDDDDYYATTAPPVLGVTHAEGQSSNANAEDSESDLDNIDEVDDDVEEEHQSEQEVPMQPEPELEVTPEGSISAKEGEKQLSKKERKKKELEELEALLAEYAVAPKESSGNGESHGIPKEKNDGEANGGKNEDAPVESKNAKKKKKKDKGPKEAKQPQNQTSNNHDEAAKTGPAEEDACAVDIKEKLKKLSSVKKKKSTKGIDAGAKAASVEAAARSARLAACKKKEKNHYNQQPVR